MNTKIKYEQMRVATNPVVQKPINANPGLKINRWFISLVQKCFFAAYIKVKSEE